MNGRLIDIPYVSTVPLLFTFQQSATVNGLLQYTFPINKQAFQPDRPIRPNALYMFTEIEVAFNIDEFDYFGAMNVYSGTTVNVPRFHLYTQSELAPAMREPLQLQKYIRNMPYPLHILGKELQEASYNISGTPGTQTTNTNRLLGTFEGTVSQTAALTGVANLTGIVQLSALEISDDAFIQEFLCMSEKYCKARKG